MVLNGDLRLDNPELPVIYANSVDSDQTPCFAASDLAFHSLPMSQSRFYRYPPFTLHSDVYSTRHARL